MWGDRADEGSSPLGVSTAHEALLERRSGRQRVRSRVGRVLGVSTAHELLKRRSR